MILTEHITGEVTFKFKDKSTITLWLSYRNDAIGIGPEVEEVTIEHLDSELDIKEHSSEAITYKNKKIHSSALFGAIEEYLELEDDIPEILKEDEIELNVSLKELLDEILEE